ncbi:MAG: dioxygenase [Pseudomonadota bacterium]
MAATSAEDTLVAQVIAAYARTDNPRWNEVLEPLLRHLHAFAREVRLSPEEWFAAIEFLTRTGQTCVGPRQEFILLSDTLGLSSAVDDLTNAGSGGATDSAVTGPFYAPHSPWIENGDSIALAGGGELALITGTVRNSDGIAVGGALLDIWQTSPNKLYAVQDPAQPEMNCRGKLLSREDGSFEFRTFKPVSYPVPVDGPVGILLQKAGRHPMRPAHMHFTISAAGHRTVTTQLFTRDDAYIDSDAVFGVKTSLLVDYTRVRERDDGIVWTLAHDFVLAPVPPDA